MIKNLKLILLTIILSVSLFACQNQTTTVILLDEEGVLLHQYQTSNKDDVLSESLYVTDREGYTFDQWYQTVDEDYLKIYQAAYTLNTYELTFDTDGGTELPLVTLDYQSVLSGLTTPEKDDAYFAGWFEDDEFEMPLSDNLLVTQDMTLYAKWQTSPFTYRINASNDLIVTGLLYQEHINELTIPDEIDDQPVISVDRSTFVGFEDITTLTLPNSIQYLPQNLLGDLTQIEQLSLPFVGRERIPESTADGLLAYLFYPEEFSNTYNINAIASSVPDTIHLLTITDATMIGDYALAIEGAEMGIDIFDGLTKIGRYAFEGTVIYPLNLPSTLEMVDDSTFAHNQIGQITIDSDNPYYANAFREDMVRLPGLYSKDLTELIAYPLAFNDYGRVIFSDNIERIGDYVFSGDDNIRFITIPDTVVDIGAYAFANASNLVSVEFTEHCSLETINRNAFSNSSLSYITIPNTVTLIDEKAFAYNQLLSEVIFAENSQLLEIGNNAFIDTGLLSEIIIPNSVETIGQRAFNSLFDLTIYSGLSEKPSGWNEEWYDSNCTVIWAN